MTHLHQMHQCLPPTSTAPSATLPASANISALTHGRQERWEFYAGIWGIEAFILGPFTGRASVRVSVWH